MMTLLKENIKTGIKDTRQCEICSGLSGVWAYVKDHTYYACSECGHIFIADLPTQDVLDSVYSGADYYSNAESQRERINQEARGRLFILKQFAEKFRLQKSLLDVGCASGIFLRTAGQNGWSAMGQDRSVQIAEHAQKQGGIKVLSGIIEDSNISEAPFPVVTAWEVIEHSINPRAFFAALARNVSAEGLIAISTPLADGLPSRILRDRYPMLCPPEHLRIFSNKSLRILSEEFGFKVISFKSFSNLRPKSLASGLYIKLFRKELSKAGKISKLLFEAIGLSFGWLPLLVDSLGYGTSMQVVLKRNG